MAVLEGLRQEQWRVERVDAENEQTIALQEQRLHALEAELRHAREEYGPEKVYALESELRQARDEYGPGPSMHQLTLERQQLTLEMHDKLRFTELQLAGSREDGSRLAHSVEDLRARLVEMESELLTERERQRRQEPAVRELHRSVQAAEDKKHAALEELQQERLRVERVSAAKEQMIALQEQRLESLQDELRQERPEGGSAKARACCGVVGRDTAVVCGREGRRSCVRQGGTPQPCVAGRDAGTVHP